MTGQGAKDMGDVPLSALAPFLLLTFAITWTIGGGYALFPERAAAMFGEIGGGHPLFFLATWAPAIASFVIVLRHGGRGGLRRFLSRLMLWRCSAGWWVFLLAGIPAIYMLGSVWKGGALLAELPPQGLGAAIGFSLMMLCLGPVEEFGWRGLALPLLQRHLPPLAAGAALGAIWGVWHLPAFYLSSTVYADWHFLPFFVGNVTLAILVTPLFNATRGSLLLPALFHWQLIIPFWPDAQPYDTWIFVAVTALVVWRHRAAMLSRAGAATTVIPQA